jgi:hypothetical protein
MTSTVKRSVPPLTLVKMGNPLVRMLITPHPAVKQRCQPRLTELAPRT